MYQPRRSMLILLTLISILLQSIFSQSALINGPGGSSRIRITNENPIHENANPAAYQISGHHLTIEAWIYPMMFPPQLHSNHVAGLAFYPEMDPWKIYGLAIDNDSGEPLPVFSISNNEAGSEVIVQANEAIPLHQWTHLAGTYDGENLHIYMNGELKGTVASNLSIAGEGVGFYIGRYIYDRSLGLISQVRLWDITRTQTEIQDNMQTNFSGSENGLKGYWRLDNETNLNEYRIAVDATENHNDLIVQGEAEFTPFPPNGDLGTPSYTVDASSIDFGIVEQADIATYSVTINNTSADPLLGTGVVEDPQFSFDLVAGFFVQPQFTQDVNFSLSSLNAGQLSGSLAISSNAETDVILPFTMQSIALQNVNANNINMWLQRDGRFARNPFPPRNAGFEWPAGSGTTAIYASGVWVGARVNGEIRTAVAQYEREFRAGQIVNGVPADPNNLQYRVYKIQAGDDASNIDYAEWPIHMGAPANPDGSPLILGDQTLFHVYNDLDGSAHFDEAGPLGVEVQQTTFAVNLPGPYSNTVFMAFKIINRSADVWEDAHLTLWCDPDMGNHADDLVGIDVDRNMAYVYNGDNFDDPNPYNEGYGDQIPAIGYKILKGAFYTKPIQASAAYANGLPYPTHDPDTGEERYNCMQGLLLDGSSRIDPETNEPSVFPFSGDPVEGTGWLDANPGDRRFILAMGPFNLDPGQSKDLVAAIIVALGTNHLNSITELRIASDEIQQMYEGGSVLGGVLESVDARDIPAGTTETLDNIVESGISLEVTSGAEGASVEIATYLDSPPGTGDMAISNLRGVGKAFDVQTIGDISWPVQITIYYTADDLLEAGIPEEDLLGLCYWNGTHNEWRLYSESGDDDQGRGTSITAVNSADIVIDETAYAGFISATVYHLTPISIGGVHPVGVDPSVYPAVVPDEFTMCQNFPNPFNPSTTIRFGLAEAADVSLVIYDVKGNNVKTLDAGYQTKGWHQLQWNGSDDNGIQVATGMYFAQLSAGSHSRVIKMVYLR